MQSSTSSFRIWNARSPSARARFGSALLCVALLVGMPIRSGATSPASAGVVLTQAIGVGSLSDELLLRLHALAESKALAVLSLEATKAALSVNRLDPLSCGTDGACLTELGRALGVRHLIVLGIGRFGDKYGLDVRAFDLESLDEPAQHSATFGGTPRPDWTEALWAALVRVLPSTLRDGDALLQLEAPAGTQISLDGAASGQAPLERPLRVDAGEHVVTLTHPESFEARERFRVEAGELRRLAPVLVRKSEAPPDPWPYVSGGLGIAALSGAIFLHASAVATIDDAAQEKALGRPFLPLRRRALDDARFAQGLYGAAAVGIGTAIYLFLTADEAAP